MLASGEGDRQRARAGRGLRLRCRRSHSPRPPATAATPASTPTTPAPTPCSARSISRRLQPYGNLYSTAPGAEQQVARPQFRFNFLAPLNFDFESLRRLGSGSERELGHLSGRQSLLGGAGRRPAVPGVGQRPLRVQELLQRVRRRHRPADLLRPPAICRPDQRPGLLALFRHHAALQLSADLLGSDRGAAGLQPRLQQELPSRQLLPA